MKSKNEIIAQIQNCKDEKLLRNWIKNAKRLGESEIEDAAFKKLIQILPSEQPGTLEWDFWRTIHAFETTLSDENGKTTRLSRTRQKIGRDGVHKTLSQWALDKKETAGFGMLRERGMLELAGEAIVLRHAAQFDQTVLDAARQRLADAGLDVGKFSGD